MAALKDHVIDFLINKLSSIRSNRKQNKPAIFNTEEQALFDKTGIYIYEDVRKTKLKLHNDSVLSKAILEGFEENELNFIYYYLREDDIFLDVGTNIGLFALTAAKKIKQGAIIAFEPSPTTFERLNENLHLNKAEELIKPFNLALSSKPDTLDFYLSLDGFDAWNGFTIPQVGSDFKRLKIACTTLDIFCSVQNLSKIDLIKIDVEGWEYPVLQGAKEVIQKFSPDFLIEFTEENAIAAGNSCNHVFDLLTGLGYTWYEVKPDLSLNEFKRQESYEYSNLFATRNIERTLLRLSEK